MPKYHLVSDVLFDFGFYDDEGMNWADLLNIINGEWAEGKIKLLRARPELPEPEVWEPTQREVKITMTSGKRWIKCAVYQGSRNILFEDPLILEKDVLYVMGKAAVAGIIVAEQSNDTEVQSNQPDGSVAEPLITASDAKLHEATISGKRPTHSPRARGPKAEVGPRVIEAMLSDINERRLTPEELNNSTEEALAAQYNASRDTVRKARDVVLNTIVDN